MSAPSTPPQRVAIIGGGCASLAAAFELSRPEHQGRYEITVYQLGWRLGGKGASGRGPSQRIEEHGLHLWMGFYENAFALMRACYAERRQSHPDARFADWRDAFKPAPDVAVADRLGQDWSSWRAHFAPGCGEPGDPLSQGSPFTVLAYLRQSAGLVAELLRSAGARGAAPASARGAAGSPAGAAAADPGRSSPQAIGAAVEALLRYGQFATLAAAAEASELLLQAINSWVPQMLRDSSALLIKLIEALARSARQHTERLAAADTELRRIWQVIDLILAILRGATLQGLAFDPRGFDAINAHDWRDWLRANGASEAALQSGFLRAIYDLAFAFEDGDVERPRLAAGVALRGAMRMFFTYRGALFYSMSAGMGEVVFAPLYQVLKRRGVKFAFFHRLRNVALAPAQAGQTAWVQALQFDVQAEPAGSADYQPLVAVRGVPCWPSRPGFEQLQGGAALQDSGVNFEADWDTTCARPLTLQVVRDFDFVVLGVSIGALPQVAAELIQREPRWRDMVRHVKTVPTQAFQVWLREDMPALGWPHAPGNLSGFVEPFDTWADMRHLIPEEDFEAPVRAIAYFCSVLPDAAPINGDLRGLHQQQAALVRNNAVGFLDRDIGALWPRALRPEGGFRWGLLVPADADEPADAAPADATRFASQYWTANVNASDRYVQSLPGSPAFRLSPLDRSFDNLTIAGDWTANGLDTGCIESAVISGRLAAHAIAQWPPLEDIVGYDHP